MRRRFATVDVFTATPFTGNPLAVVLDAAGLSTAQMQAVAREFNTVETTFVLPPQDPAHTARVRIFTPDREVPFAGHPNVGTAFVLAQQGEAFGRPVSEQVAFEEGAGLVPVRILREGGTVTGAELTAPEPFQLGAGIDAAAVAAALSLDAGDIAADRHGPVVASVGLPFLVAALGGRDALARIAPDPAALAGLFQRAGVTGLYVYTRDTASRDGACDLSARMVCRMPMVIEDPATGSATCALAGLFAHLAPPDAAVTFTAAQGVDMGRSSLLHARARKRGDVVEAVHVGGHCVAVMEGSVHLPGAG